MNTAAKQSSPLPGSSRANTAVYGMCAFLAAVVFLLFGDTLRSAFVNFDDDQYVYENPMVAQGLTAQGIVWAFSQSHAANWHPVTWIAHMLDCDFYGLNPGGHHFTNVILHAANAILVFLLLRQLTGSFWRSSLVAALFASHPLHVESVAWISERKDVLSAFFGLASLLMYARYAQKRLRLETPGAPGERIPALGSQRSTFDYGLALFLFALGLMSKPMLVTLPFVMLLLDFWPLRRFEKPAPAGRRAAAVSLTMEKLPFLALSAASGVVTFLVQSRSGAVHSFANIPMAARIENAFVSYARYLFKLIWPVNLAVPYPHPGYWPADKLWTAIILFFVAGMVALWFARRAPYVTAGWCWYVGMLIPVIGLIQTGAQSMADRYTYLPMIGILITVVWSGGALAERWRSISVIRPVIAGMAVLAVVACGALTVRQVRFWRDSETLFRHATEVTRNNDVAYYNLGCFCQQAQRIDEAIAYFRTALKIRACYDDALNNLGIALASKGETEEGIRCIREAIRCQPAMADSHYNLGNVFVMERKFDDAAASYREALRLNPDFAPAHYNLANILAMQGHPDEAVRHYRETLRLNPQHQGAQQQLRALTGLAP